MTVLPKDHIIENASIEDIITKYPDTQIHLSRMINLRRDETYNKTLHELNNDEIYRIKTNGFHRLSNGDLFSEISLMADMSISDLYC